jgi:multifunctional methyltransferase subunit TRM112
LCDTFPLQIKATNKKLEKKEVNIDFIKNFLVKLDYAALLSAANDVNLIVLMK